MKKWLRRLRGMVGMGVTWAVGWAIAGVLIGITSNLLPGLPWHYFFDVFDAPLPALAIPGFVGGVLYSIVLGIAGRHRRFDELSLLRVAAWGAVGGLMLTLIPAAMVTVGLATLRPDANGWLLTAIISVPFLLMGAASATGSLMVARLAYDRESLDSGQNVAEVESASGEAHQVLRRE